MTMRFALLLAALAIGVPVLRAGDAAGAARKTISPSRTRSRSSSRLRDPNSSSSTPRPR